MESTPRENTIVYTLLDVADASPRRFESSTPRGNPRDDIRAMERSRLLESIDFDGPSPLATMAGKNYKVEQPRNTLPEISTMKTPLTVKGLFMKPNKFDGTTSLESFLTQFEVCARHNQWTASDKVDFLRCSLEKSATQLLWDFGAHTNVNYEQLVERLRQRYGAEGQAETFRAQLYYRR